MSDIESETFENNTDIKETIKEIENDILESGDEGESTKTLQKPKKPRSEKQKEALRKAQEARKLKALKKKELDKAYEEDSDYFKRLTPKQRKELKKIAVENIQEGQVDVSYVGKDKRLPKKKLREDVEYESDPSSDEEVIIVKKKKKKKKTKKKVIYESASSSSDEDEPIVKQIQKTKIKKEKDVVFSDEEDLYYEYQQPQPPLTYGSVARFL
tara:strand:- start:2608 stop:3246 length:639 start_codon:yes stop_codon:yes gene_type:complete